MAFAGLLAAPALALAQARGASASASGQHEFGVDIGIGYTSPSGGQSSFGLTAPFGDIRIGFPSSSSMSLEGRLSASFASGGGTFITFDPGLNLMFGMGHATAHNNNKYFTVGADVAIVSQSPSGGTSNSGAVITINGGVGARMPWGAQAKRGELFVAYSLKNTSLGVPNTFAIGARLGLSFWN